MQWWLVTPFTGVWIEILGAGVMALTPCSSHPSRVCGLKSGARVPGEVGLVVTPFTGVWIEISRTWRVPGSGLTVTPFTGVWIEISSS